MTSRKPGGHPASQKRSTHDDDSTIASVALRRRRDAAQRLLAFDDGRADPLDRLAQPHGPSDFGLPADDLCAHAAELRRRGWMPGEIVLVLAVDPECAS